MSWAAIARKDFSDAVRSKALWALTALFVVFMLGAAAGYGYFFDTTTAVDLLDLLSGPVNFLIPITALLATIHSISGELESGTSKLLLSLPHTRRDVVIGKIVGRSAVMLIAVFIGVMSAGAYVFAVYTTVDAINYLGFAVFALLLALVYTSIGVGLSALARSTSRSTIIAAGFYTLLSFVWPLILSVVAFTTSEDSILNLTPGRRQFLNQIPPTDAITTARAGFTSVMNTPAALATSKWVLLVIAIAWLLGVPAIGYWRFNTRDL
ncbi:ABC transporter permease [Halobacterium salinarum]|uniref:ABC transporter permease n=1 Tax=Halobacterium salinarum TaxID=2242 RepID=UPI0025564BA2|nr:ABC transporter permease [Halobacterium salinarum]MDL0127114.1 ABC transporter permease [Halobacterium salinarum]MDL0144227.1 ABC transporter permease [Halobacterium salinarum]